MHGLHFTVITRAFWVGVAHGEKSALARKRTKQICGSTCGEKFEKILDDDMKFDAKKHLKAHRIKKERAKMALFEFVMEAMRQQIGWRRKEQIWMVVQWPCKMLPLFTANGKIGVTLKNSSRNRKQSVSL